LAQRVLRSWLVLVVVDGDLLDAVLGELKRDAATYSARAARNQRGLLRERDRRFDLPMGTRRHSSLPGTGRCQSLLRLHWSAVGSAPRRRETPVEEDSTRIIVDRFGS